MTAAKLSQNALEELAGLSSGYVSRLLGDSRGERISLDILRSISDVLDVSTDWLIKGFDKDPYPERAEVVRIARVRRVPAVVIDQLYGGKYEGRADLRKSGWMAALDAEHSSYLRAGVQGLKEDRAAKKAAKSRAEHPPSRRRRAG